MNQNLDYFRLLAEGKAANAEQGLPRLRLAFLADCATQHFVPLFRALFRRHGIEVDTYEGGFDAIELDAYNPKSTLYAFNPEIVVILSSVQSLRDKFYLRNLD